jgi:hypothetical protein
VADARLERGPCEGARHVDVSWTSWHREIVLGWNSIVSVFLGVCSVSGLDSIQSKQLSLEHRDSGREAKSPKHFTQEG